MVKAAEIRQKYLAFFEDRGHIIVPSSPLVPENDPTTLFTGSGMQPMLPYLLGEPYPGKVTRIVDSQKCFRAQDIEEVGDNRHTTFFEMLGNWSLGDYFKEDQLAWFYLFLTKELELPSERLFVSVFEGDKSVPRDEETANIWKKLGIPESRIYYYGVNKNWWSRSGPPDLMPAGEPGGPDSEVFFEFTQVEHNPKFGKKCHPNCDCGRFLEIGNSVFMTYKKTDSGFVPLEKKNIDFGGGLERLVTAANDNPDIFEIDIFKGAKEILQDVDVTISPESERSIRIILDHLRAALFIIDAGIVPANKDRGYLLRRLIRRSAAHAKIANINLGTNSILLRELGKGYVGVYPSVVQNIGSIHAVISQELVKFERTLETGMKQIGKASSFDLYQTYGFPPEMVQELTQKQGLEFDWEEFEKEKQKHQDLSRTASAGMFKGGLQDQSEVTTKYHTATHLLHAALRQVLGSQVQQKGSNITSARLRFDFSHPRKLTGDELKQIEDMVNQKVSGDMKVERLEMDKRQALAMGALAFFPEKYPDRTSVYKIGDFSLELCGGPHVNSTGEIGRIKITREESAGAGIRRIYATAVS